MEEKKQKDDRKLIYGIVLLSFLMVSVAWWTKKPAEARCYTAVLYGQLRPMEVTQLVPKELQFNDQGCLMTNQPAVAITAGQASQDVYVPYPIVYEGDTMLVYANRSLADTLTTYLLNGEALTIVATGYTWVPDGDQPEEEIFIIKRYAEYFTKKLYTGEETIIRR